MRVQVMVAAAVVVAMAIGGEVLEAGGKRSTPAPRGNSVLRVTNKSERPSVVRPVDYAGETFSQEPPLHQPPLVNAYTPGRTTTPARPAARQVITPQQQGPRQMVPQRKGELIAQPKARTVSHARSAAYQGEPSCGCQSAAPTCCGHDAGCCGAPACCATPCCAPSLPCGGCGHHGCCHTACCDHGCGCDVGCGHACCDHGCGCCCHNCCTPKLGVMDVLKGLFGPCNRGCHGCCQSACHTGCCSSGCCSGGCALDYGCAGCGDHGGCACGGGGEAPAPTQAPMALPGNGSPSDVPPPPRVLP